MLGNGEESETLLRDVLDRRLEVLGERHPQTLNSMGALAMRLLESGRSAEARQLAGQAVLISTKVLGPVRARRRPPSAGSVHAAR